MTRATLQVNSKAQGLVYRARRQGQEDELQGRRRMMDNRGVDSGLFMGVE